MKILKKIAPLLVAGLFLGTTALVGAADLSTWKTTFPGPDTAIVLGADADTVDTIGAIDIATAITTSEEGDASITGEAEKIEASSNKLNINETFAEIETGGFDKEELPTMLADKTYKAHDGGSFSYTQKISFGSVYPHFVFKEDSDYATDPDSPNLMIYGADSKEFINYSLTFTTTAKSTNTSGTLDDFEDSDLEILGNDYSIVNADVSGTKIILDLMTGPVRQTLVEGDSATYTIDDKEYVVTLSIVDDSGNAVFVINDETTDEITKGGTYKLEDDTEIGVSETTYQSWAGGIRQAKFYLGSQKLTIKDTDYGSYAITDATKVKLNDVTVKDLRADVDASWDGTDLGINKIIFYWVPSSEVFVTEEDSVLFPGLESFKVTFEGLDQEYEEEISLKHGGNSNIRLTVPIKDAPEGKTIDVLHSNGTSFDAVGKDTTSKLLTGATGTNTWEKGTHDYFIATDTSNYETRIVKPETPTDCDGSPCVTLIDYATESECIDKKAGTTCSFGDVTITINTVNDTTDHQNVSVTVNNMNKIYTEQGLVIYLPYEGSGAWPTVNVSESTNSSYVFKMVEEHLTTESTEGGAELNFTAGITSEKTTISAVPDTEAENAIGYATIGDTDNYAAYSKFGTYLYYKTGDTQDDVTITYPGEAVIGNAYVAEQAASIVSGTSSTSAGAPVSVMDTEIADVKDLNIISVGGSAINKVSAELLGLTYPTYGGNELWTEATGVDASGKAIIKLMDSPYTEGKFAMLVAGYEGLDTQRAATVLSEGTPSISGDSVLLDTATATVTIVA